MNRRHFLTRGLLASAAIRNLGVLSSVLLSPCVAEAQDPGTVLLVVQMALSFASLLGGGGPSETDLLNLQAEMLKTISEELQVVQQSLLVIFEQLAQLKALVRDLPDQTVLALYKAKLFGAVLHYRSVMSLYLELKRTVGIQSAQAQVAGELENEVLKGLREARFTLVAASSGSSSEVLIPYLCASLQAETHAMIMANYRQASLQTALKFYNDWFSPFVSAGTPLSLTDRNATLESSIQTTIDDLSIELSKASGEFCSVRWMTGMWENPPAHVVIRNLQTVDLATLPDTTQDQIRTAYNELAQAGVMIPTAFKEHKVITAKAVDHPMQGGLWLPLSDPNTEHCPGAAPGAFASANFPLAASGFANSIFQPITDGNEKLRMLQMQYVTSKSLHLCASDAILFIAKLANQQMAAALP